MERVALRALEQAQLSGDAHLVQETRRALVDVRRRVR